MPALGQLTQRAARDSLAQIKTPKVSIAARRCSRVKDKTATVALSAQVADA